MLVARNSFQGPTGLSWDGNGGLNLKHLDSFVQDVGMLLLKRSCGCARTHAQSEAARAREGGGAVWAWNRERGRRASPAPRY